MCVILKLNSSPIKLQMSRVARIASSVIIRFNTFIAFDDLHSAVLRLNTQFAMDLIFQH